MSGRVIVVGSVNVDLVVRGERLPGPGETVTGGTFERHHGGKGANQAVAAARLGAPTLFVGLVGDDDLGADARAALATDGVDVAALATAAGMPTGVALILVDEAGENLISVASGANGSVTPDHVARALEEIEPAPADVVLVSNEIPADAVTAALAAGRAAGATTLLNPAPASGLTPDVLALADVLTPNRSELAALAVGRPDDDPATLATSLLRGRDASNAGPAPAVVVTLGARGALAVGPGRRVDVEAFEAFAAPAPAVRSVDATGAGDAFNGCLAASLAAGMGLGRAVRRAVVAGSLATTRVGARAAMPTADELEDALR